MHSGLWNTARHAIPSLPAIIAAAALLAGGDVLAQCGAPGWLPADKPTGIGENGNNAIIGTEWDPDGAGPLPSRLVVAGAFYYAGGRLANSIAYWDGTDWHAMGDGLRDFSQPSVVALHVHNGQLFAAGSFLFSDSTFLHNIARWDGAAWQPLGDGTDSMVFSMTSFNGDLIIGGDFTSAGGLAAERIARWDGTQWHAMGDGFNGYVSTVAVYGGALYAGGGMTASNETIIDAIGRWDGSAWVAVGGGLHGSSPASVNALCTYNSELIAIGSFTSAGLTPADNVARWNGTAWLSAGAALQLPPTSAAVVGSDLITGSLWSLNNFGQILQNIPNVNRWNGTAWSPLPVVDGTPRSITTFRGQIATIGDIFTDADGERAGGVVVYDGTEWQAVGEQGLAHNSVQSIGEYQADVIIAARRDRRYKRSNGDHGMTVAISRWNNGAVIGDLGVVDVYPDMTPYVQDILQVGSDLYICGQFDTVNGIDTLNVAKWDGTTWFPLGDGIGPRGIGTNVMAEFNGQIVVGGAFVEADGAPGNSITRWDGTSWQPLGSGLQTVMPDFTDAGQVNVLLPYQGKLLVLGFFTHAGGVPANNAALWDGTTWTALPATPNMRSISSAGFYNGDLVVSGRSNSNQALGALRWDGNTWHHLGTGLENNGDHAFARSIVQAGNDLYFGGYFLTAGGAPAKHVAKWNGTNWSSLGDGIERVTYDFGGGVEVNALHVHNGELLVGGTFNKAGGQGAANFVRYCLGAATPTVSCCRGTTCNPVDAGTCTGQVAGSNSLVVSSCGAGTALASCCYADFNHDGSPTIDDLFLYLNAYFTSSPWANVGGDGIAAPTIDDLFLYINAYFTGCQ